MQAVILEPKNVADQMKGADLAAAVRQQLVSTHDP
jgi:hypothetical protein